MPTLDLTKLPAAPWEFKTDKDSGTDYVAAPEVGIILQGEWNNDREEAALKFAALARNAFDIMVRRHWFPRFCGTTGGQQEWMAFSWVALRNVHEIMADLRATEQVQNFRYPDPFTAVVAAEAWYVANVELAANPAPEE